MRDRYDFMLQSLKILTFSILSILSGKRNSFFTKLEYRFLVESTKIKNVSFAYKAAISEASVKTNRMWNTKWTYHKERSFASN